MEREILELPVRETLELPDRETLGLLVREILKLPVQVGMIWKRGKKNKSTLNDFEFYALWCWIAFAV